MKKNLASLNIDSCTHCATCLSVCPVYDITLNERYSPRGKISLINAVNKNLISPYDKLLQETISACLMCGRCSKICPADIDVSFHLKNFRAKYLKNKYPSPSLFELSKKALPFSSIVKFLGNKIFNIENKSLHPDITPINYVTKNNSEKKILLFSGCVHKYLIHDVIIQIKNYFSGSNIIIPEDQTCCGMPFWTGGKKKLSGMIMKNIDIFLKYSPEFIITGCESCAFMIQNNWIEFFNPDTIYYKKAQEFSSKTMEFTDFISKHHTAKPSENMLKILEGNILYHSPCHKTSKNTEFLLKDLFGKKIYFLQDKCCGFGGVFSMKHPDFSIDIFNKKIKGVDIKNSQYLLTNCSGCQLQFIKKLKNYNKNIKILHPAQIIE